MLEVVEVELVPGLVVAGKWRLERAIGQGGFGVVWSATEIATGEPRALKCLTKEGATDAKRQERLRREARAMSGIDHPHIARVFGIEELPAGTPFFVMELLRGRTLHAQLQRGPLSVQQARGILIQIADALRTVHARGIIHRDLKPANVIIIDDRYAKVLDFGISKDMSAGEVKQLTTTGTALGTLNYMAPEQIFGEKNLDPRCDVWALGVIAHECLTLRRPTDGEGPSSGQVLKAILEGSFPRLSSKIPDCPPDIDELVARMLLRNAADRPTSEEVFTTLALAAISPTMRRTLPKDQMLATLPISEAPLFARTIRDERFAASQLVPSTVVPPTEVVPSTVVPATVVPSTQVPSTQIPATQVPATVLVAPDDARPRPAAHAATIQSPGPPRHVPSDGALHVAPAVTPIHARPLAPQAPPTTVLVDARGRAAHARSRGLLIALAVFGAFVAVGMTIFVVGTDRMRRGETTASATASGSASQPVSTTSIAAAAASAPLVDPEPVAPAPASASAASSAPTPAVIVVAKPASTSKPASSATPKPKPTAPTAGDPPISNERF